MRLQEFDVQLDIEQIVKDFLSYAKEFLQLQTLPDIQIVKDSDFSAENHTFGHYNRQNKQIVIQIEHRHVFDILRTLAHELVHYRQDSLDQLHDESGMTGSEHENEANSLAGVMMRNFTKENKHLFGRPAE